MVKIVPTILTKDLKEANLKLQKLQGLVKAVHIDILDGEFASNKTFSLKSLRKLQTLENFNLFLHLMVKKPLNYLKTNLSQDIDLGKTTTVMVQQESLVNFEKLNNFLKKRKFKLGLVLDLDTKLEAINAKFLSQADLVMLMMVKAGFSGQEFQDKRLKDVEKLLMIKKENNFKFKIALDGGINKKNIKSCVKAGGQLLFVHTSLWQNGKVKENLRRLKKLVNETDKKPAAKT